jgi:hypothetical protein
MCPILCDIESDKFVCNEFVLAFLQIDIIPWTVTSVPMMANRATTVTVMWATTAALGILLREGGGGSGSGSGGGRG